MCFAVKEQTTIASKNVRILVAKKRGGWSDELCERMEEVREGSFGAVLMEKTLWVGQFGMRILPFGCGAYMVVYYVEPLSGGFGGQFLLINMHKGKEVR